MPGGNGHRILETLYSVFTPNIGPGIVNDPGDGGTIEFKKLLDYLAQYDKIDGVPVFKTDEWYIGAADWTVTSQGRYNLKYNEGRFRTDGGTENLGPVRTIPSKGKWTFTKAELKDFEPYEVD